MEFEIKESEILILRLSALPDKVRIKLEKQATAAVNRMLVSAIKSNAAIASGALQKSITSKVRVYKGGKIIVGITGPDKDFQGNIVEKKNGSKGFQKTKKGAQGGGTNYRRPAKYAHLVDGGTKNRTTAMGKNRGSVTGTKFMTATVEGMKAQIKSLFENAVKEAVSG
jgi:hypothetical protein